MANGRLTYGIEITSNELIKCYLLKMIDIILILSKKHGGLVLNIEELICLVLNYSPNDNTDDDNTDDDNTDDDNTEFIERILEEVEGEEINGEIERCVLDALNNNTDGVEFMYNGACCCEGDTKFFCGWSSNGVWSNGAGSRRIDMFSYNELKRINSFLREYFPYDKPHYYIMAQDCDFCT